MSCDELDLYRRGDADYPGSLKKKLIKSPFKRMNKNFRVILRTYRSLNNEVRAKSAVPPASEWLLDNFYIIEEEVQHIRRDSTKKSFMSLPILWSGKLVGHSRIYGVLYDLVNNTNGLIDDKKLTDHLKHYQTQCVLFNRELMSIPPLMTMALLENIRTICDTIDATQTEWHAADDVFHQWLDIGDLDTEKIVDLIQDNLHQMKTVSPTFIDHLFYHLRRSGRSYAGILHAMDQELEKRGLTTEQIIQEEHNTQSVMALTLGNYITTLSYFLSLDWSELFDSVSVVEKVLRQDPDYTYPMMDAASRIYYRGKVEELAVICEVSELRIAELAIALAKQASTVDDESCSPNANLPATCHVGYYIIGNGVLQLEKSVGKTNGHSPQKPGLSVRKPGMVYIGSIGLTSSVLIAATLGCSLLVTGADQWYLLLLLFLGIIIPFSEIAMEVVNWIVCRTLKPAFFPRFDLEAGIPKSLSTIIAIPTLLPDEKRARELLQTLENHYISNREDNLYFVLIGAFSDSNQPRVADEDRIIETTLAGIQELNRRYSKSFGDRFYFFHRRSQFSPENNLWFGWERKRGALIEFNDLVLGSDDTSFVHASAIAPPFADVKYVITLDNDTLLPMGMAKKMIATMAHPMQRPVIDPKRNVVIAGFGILQPSIDVENESANRSLFSRIFTGKVGMDFYANAISDAYQDLFGEGIFVGKGIYDLRVFQQVLKDAVPDNTILSHDLLEGSYLRTGLVSDLKLIDSHPLGYNSYKKRLHRWVRGDWQLIKLLNRTVKNREGKRIPNPLSWLSRWKIFDNLRRSLLAPALMFFTFLSFTILPLSLYLWLGVFLITLLTPLIMTGIGYITAIGLKTGRIRHYTPIIRGLKAVFLQFLLTLVFFADHAWQMIHAISVTLVRVFITQKNLLLWVTSDDLEKFQNNSLTSYVLSLKSSLFQAALLVLLTLICRPESIGLAIIFALVWAAAPVIAFEVSKDRRHAAAALPEKDIYELKRIARKTWRYFEEFTNNRGNFLPPDNYQEDPPKGIAYRTSPTNIGLGLLAILTARDFGYIGTHRMIDLLERTIGTMESLEKWHGHLYNWYQIKTLKPLRPTYVSTVDSGNLLCYLTTLKQGLTEYLHQPVVDASFFSGIKDTLNCAEKKGYRTYEQIFSKELLRPDQTVDLFQWNASLNELIAGKGLEDIEANDWRFKIEKMLWMYKKELTKWMPWIELFNVIPPELYENDQDGSIAHQIAAATATLNQSYTLWDLPGIYKGVVKSMAELADILPCEDTETRKTVDAWFEKLDAELKKAVRSINLFKKRYKLLIKRIDDLSNAMDFTPLYDKKKDLFSIGFNVDDMKLSNSYYDLLASESRQVSYICIAKGMVPALHWYKLNRALTSVDRHVGLISWTGTMFEYLMPLLVLKNYPNTLWNETYSFVLESQKIYGRRLRIPWGISESGYNLVDKDNDYQYRAFGVPWLGLKRGLVEDSVVAPYATFLALLVNPKEALKNIRHLKAEGMEGAYGYYEAADYTPERLPFQTKRTIVKSFMAHHQGMSLMALNNTLHSNIMQNRFHADPEMHAARLLLQEKVSTNLIFTKSTKEKVEKTRGIMAVKRNTYRVFKQPNPKLPKAHILSNGNYSVLITDRGTGYSKSKIASITRWREDSTLDPYGTFFYLRNTETNQVWSATYAPLNQMPDDYEVVFTSDKAMYNRHDDMIETKTEVVVASDDNVEIRRISLKNRGDKTCTIELTSYLEAVLADQRSDVAHPAFSNLFVETSYQKSRKCIIANRRPRSENEELMWMANAVVHKCDIIGDIQYETDRLKFLGRGNNPHSIPIDHLEKPLSNTIGPVLDPVMSLRLRFRIEPNKLVQFSFLTAVSDNRENLLDQIDRHATFEAVEQTFFLAVTRGQVESEYLDMDTTEIELYQNLISDIIFISPLRRNKQELILKNTKGQSALWKYGISGDLPIVFLAINQTNQMGILYEILRAHDYWRTMDLRVDLVILTDEEYNYSLPLHQLIIDYVLASQSDDAVHRTGDVFILDKNKLSPDDLYLFYGISRIILSGDAGTLAEQTQTIKNEPPLPRKIFSKTERAFPIMPAALPDLLYENGLGGFNRRGNEYLIHLDPGDVTPAPWINVIANPQFGFTVSESGSGYVWSKNSRENKITPWSNDAVSDPPGEIIYLQDDQTGALWTATALPIREDSPYRATHGFGYSCFEHSSHGIAQQLTMHVPVHDPVKLSILSLKNQMPEPRELTLTYYLRPVLGVSDQVTAIHLRSSLENSQTLVIRNPFNEEFPEDLCFMDSSLPVSSFTGDRKTFFGKGHLGAPAALCREALSGLLGIGYDPCGAIQVKVTLEANAEEEIVFVLGMADSYEELKRLTAIYTNPEKAQASLAEAKAFWQEKMAVITVTTPAPAMNLLLNGWLQYQVIACRLWARSAFYQSGGAFGFRDQLQDCLAIASMWPELSRKQILLHASHQYPEGDVQHWWHEPQGKGTRTHFSDDRLWLPYVTAEYIRITGDIGILNETIGFLDEPLLTEYEDERYGSPRLSTARSSLYDHCLRALDISLKFGAHGLPLMGSGDWNDGMNTVGNKGLGESVWLGWFLLSTLESFAPLCQKMDEPQKASNYLLIREKIRVAIEKNAWDGSWYRRAYFDNGQALGSMKNDECKIDSLAQSWSIISGAGNKARSLSAMQAVETFLISREEGLIKLLTPPFDQSDLEPGYIKGYIPGVRENGGQYTHAAAWVIIAYAKLGDGNKAFELFELVNPVNHTTNRADCNRYKVEPYVLAADVYSTHPHTGRGGWTWYTGAAGWIYRAGLESILGFKKNGNTISFDPCIPADWPAYQLTYQHQHTRYEITVKNPTGVTNGVVEIRVDGQTVADNLLHLDDDGGTHTVDATILPVNLG
nr:glucoamylase family protein [uncultured Acetobacterium sp.]